MNRRIKKKKDIQTLKRWYRTLELKGPDKDLDLFARFQYKFCKIRQISVHNFIRGEYTVKDLISNANDGYQVDIKLEDRHKI